eukprot:8205166-Ditylum_brightwellii.AAC.1
MQGYSMQIFLPIHPDAFEHCNKLLAWVRDWTGHPHLSPLTLEEWYIKGQGIIGGKVGTEGLWLPKYIKTGTFLWAPPPSAGDVAVEEL